VTTSREPRTIPFYLDYISSNAYLAWTQLPRIEESYGVVFEPVPVLFAGLLESTGLLGPAEVAPKRRWMGRNNLRKAALLGVPLEPPRFHPFNPLLALRASSLPMEPAQRAALVGALFRAVWVEQLHVSEPAVVQTVADGVGLDGAALVARAQQPEAKARLRAQTDDAIAAGVFGVPSMALGDEIFWGYDDLPYLELVLAGKDPLDPKELGKWGGAQRPSAMRRKVHPAGEGG